MIFEIAAICRLQKRFFVQLSSEYEVSGISKSQPKFFADVHLKCLGVWVITRMMKLFSSCYDALVGCMMPVEK